MDFKDKFIQLSYSKQDNPDNMKVKYIINKLQCFYSEEQRDVFADDGSIEHILPESTGEKALNIGNMILLEATLNNEAGEEVYTEKISIYRKSKYNWVKRFIEEHDRWDEKLINVRAEKMADVYYHQVLKRR